jgi:predicted nucleic acid-binding protein
LPAAIAASMCFIVATALHLEASEFLTFDTNQRKLAAVEGLAIKP